MTLTVILIVLNLVTSFLLILVRRALKENKISRGEIQMMVTERLKAFESQHKHGIDINRSDCNDRKEENKKAHDFIFSRLASAEKILANNKSSVSVNRVLIDSVLKVLKVKKNAGID